MGRSHALRPTEKRCAAALAILGAHARVRRSPWTNEYDPPLSDGVLPSPKLRAMETLANDIFEGYREMYYEGGISSVYFWDLDECARCCGCAPPPPHTRPTVPGAAPAEVAAKRL